MRMNSRPKDRSEYEEGRIAGAVQVIAGLGAIGLIYYVVTWFLSQPSISAIATGFVQWATTPQISPLGLLQIFFVLAFFAVILGVLQSFGGVRA